MFGANVKRELVQELRRNSGFITSSGATRIGLQRRELTFAVEKGELVRVGRGLYCTPETWEDEYVISQYRYSSGIFSHETALYLLDLSDQAPECLTMSFPRGYNTSPAKHAGILTKSSPAGRHSLGRSLAVTPYGNKVTCYDAERSLCDMVRGTAAPNLQVLNPAIRAYLSSSKRNIAKLRDYAQALGVARKIGAYLEVLL